MAKLTKKAVLDAIEYQLTGPRAVYSGKNALFDLMTEREYTVERRNGALVLCEDGEWYVEIKVHVEA